MRGSKGDSQGGREEEMVCRWVGLRECGTQSGGMRKRDEMRKVSGRRKGKD